MKYILTLSLCVSAATLLAQLQEDTVAAGPSYINEIWYKLDGAVKTTKAVSEWDIAFMSSNQGSAVRINEGGAVKLWLPANSDTTNFATLDTTGMASWTTLYNSDTTWETGAFNKPAAPGDDFDLGWGKYNMVTHAVSGTKIFLLKAADGSFKKLWIKSLAGGIWTVRFANLDNSDDHTATIAKSSYNTKNLVYYNLRTKTIANREPATSDWDLYFGRYIDNSINYLVSGVLINKNLEAAKAYPVADADAYTDANAFPYSARINTIGSDWKSFDMSTFQWVIADSTVYFVKDQGGNTFKLIFTGFGGTGSGAYYFKREKLQVTSTSESIPTLHHIYPNPLKAGTDLHLVVDLNGTARISITDMQGNHTMLQEIDGNGLGTHRISIPHLATGLYVLQISSGGHMQTHKLIIR
jgi:hypothetical protein